MFFKNVFLHQTIRKMNKTIIRPLTPSDDEALAVVVRDVLIEMGVPKVGTAYEDKALDCMYETYNQNRMQYFVVVEDDQIIGGAGIAPLAEANRTICELQKMYFSPKARGRGLGSEMMKVCLDFAKEQDYTHCYLETLPYMEAARKLYKRTGFEPLKAAMGNTGHYSCSMWMLKEL